jgi:3-phenylpropionate/trans-cinnamate dioxygenase ferredoxin reductase subunit
MSDQETFVIVGAGLAGARAAGTLREEGFAGRIVLVGDEEEPPYNRPPLSKGYLAGSDERSSIFEHELGWYAEHDIELMLGHRVTMLDTAGHSVTLDGYQQLPYTKLLLATGSKVIPLDVPGAGQSGVRYLRTVEDSDALLAGLRRGGRLVVVGAGWIGLEVAAAARGHGAQVTVVEVDTLPLRRVLGDEVAKIFRDLHTEHGVEFRFNAGVERVGGSGGTATGVALTDGTLLPADLVAVGIGVRPATDLATAGGLAVDDGVVTDEHLRTSHPDVYACGDVASSHRPWLGRRVRVEHWSNAYDGGPAAARAMLGADGDGYDQAPFFFSDQYDLGLEYVGHVPRGGHDRVVFRGDVGKREFLAFWLKENRVLAGMNVNVWDVSEDIQRLARAGHAGRAVDPARLTDPSVPLTDLLG